MSRNNHAIQWTDEATQFIKDSVGSMTIVEISKALCMNESTVGHYAREMGFINRSGTCRAHYENMEFNQDRYFHLMEMELPLVKKHGYFCNEWGTGGEPPDA